MDNTLVAHQMELEQLYNKNQTVSRIRKEFTDCDFPFANYMVENGIPIEFGFDLLVQMVLHKRCNLPTLVGTLRRHLNDAQLTADMILRCAEADLVDWNTNLEIFIVKFNITDDVQRELDLYQFPLPMVVEPRPITHNLENGYLLSKGSVILRDNHHSDDVCLDHLNRMNKIKFCVNNDTARMVQNKWRNLDKPKEGESKEDFNKRRKAFEKYDRTTREVMDKLTEHGNEFYLTHKYDKRGRVYCQGYHVNYQGAPWNKSVLELADKEFVE